MRLTEALRINQQPAPSSGKRRNIVLTCGFTPLHLQTLLKAHLRVRFPDQDAEVTVGLFGDLEGNLARAASQAGDGAFVPIEWGDVDERLGLRSSAGWSESMLEDIVPQARQRLQRLAAGVTALAKRMPVAVTAPTLPLPPLSYLPPSQTGAFELQLQASLLEFLNRICGVSSLRLVSDSTLALRSPITERRDVKMELLAGFPFSVHHADVMAELAVECLFPPTPKKGLITDVDDTLWCGILGDAGIEGVSWCLDQHSQIHAVYQQLLASLAESGVLIAIASKNDPKVLKEALGRADLLIREKDVFPVEASWSAKSEAVGRILKAWNIGADSVVFIDDSPMELAEVAEKYTGMECLRFPPDDPAGVLKLVYKLRERFGKSEIRDEDRLRLQSLRSRALLPDAQSAEASADFVARLQANLVFEFRARGNDARALELVNKTNQFNLNGRRYTESDWTAYFERPGAFLLTVSYQDRFGPLGKIAALLGRVQPDEEHPQQVQIDAWVMSCRAFSRQIEFQTLQQVYKRFGVDRVSLGFEKTDRNGPLQEFFARFVPDIAERNFDLDSATFQLRCPELYHEVIQRADNE